MRHSRIRNVVISARAHSAKNGRLIISGSFLSVFFHPIANSRLTRTLIVCTLRLKPLLARSVRLEEILLEVFDGVEVLI